MFWLFALQAFASDAEGDRLREELNRLVVNAQWEGVDRTYRRMVQNHPTSLAGEQHMAAADASFHRGDLLGAKHRLERVLPGDPRYDDAVASVERLQTTTGLVVVQGAEQAVLVVDSLSLDPRLRQATTAATNALAAEGVFVGLLPIGQYQLDGAPFRVRRGMGWTLLP